MCCASKKRERDRQRENGRAEENGKMEMKIKGK